MTEAGVYSSYIANCVFNGVSSSTAIVLNIVMIHAIRKTPSLPGPLKTLLLSLSVSDLGVGLLVQPLFIAVITLRMKQGTTNSTSYNSTDMACLIPANFFSYASFFGVFALSADRFLAIHLHLRYQELVTRKRVVAVVILIWMLSAFLSLIYRLWIKTVTIFVTIEIFCVVVTTIINYKIYKTVQRHSHQILALQVPQVTQNAPEMLNATRMRKVAVGTFYVYLVFLICYLPCICIHVVSLLSSDSLIGHVHFYTATLLFFNSSLNPLIYCWKMKHIRHAIMGILRNIFSSSPTTKKSC